VVRVEKKDLGDIRYEDNTPLSVYTVLFKSHMFERREKKSEIRGKRQLSRTLLDSYPLFVEPKLDMVQCHRDENIKMEHAGHYTSEPK